MKLFSLIFVFALTSASASPFAELGIGAAIDSCIYQSWQRTGDVVNINCSRDPLGYVALGYRFGGTGLVVQVDHWSSLVQKDYGLNTVSIRYRWGD